MNKLFLTVITAFVLVLGTSCATEELEDSNNLSIKGVWNLTAWNIDNGFDINNDGIISTNLLNEISCHQNETLLFEANGVVSLNTTFKPNLEIYLLNSRVEQYSFNLECDTEGVVSLATSYTKSGNTIMIGETEASIEINQMSIVFENSIEIYNEDFTEVLETRDLTLVYIKQ